MRSIVVALGGNAIASVVTHVVVDPRDHASEEPTIGPFFDRARWAAGQ